MVALGLVLLLVVQGSSGIAGGFGIESYTCALADRYAVSL